METIEGTLIKHMDYIGKLTKQRDALLEACKKANMEIITSIEIPTDTRLEKDKDNLIYVIRDMLARVNRGQQILKAAIKQAN